ncbi:F-box LRR-repeat protein [Vairimorpha necatrix]|uniref:F-box LRR-repeat protein n=1 Tax=Vairimorpha necatrix TaxID=6039 RepID=A0AAX4JDF3_9MICR
MENLEILRITGAYLLTEINLPSKLKILDLSNCNRLTNSIIQELNRKYKTLEELKLSYCYKISHEVKLKTHVKRLFLEETRIHENFYHVQNLTALSLKNCVLIDSLCEKYANLEYLDLENITTIKNINVGNKLKHLNIQRCYNLVGWIKENKSKLTNLEYLNISYLEIKDMDFLVELKNLKEINLSWCDNVTDNLLIELIKNTNIEKISVFGCFNLTLESVKISYKFKDKVLVLGNHAETKFLIQNI